MRCGGECNGGDVGSHIATIGIKFHGVEGDVAVRAEKLRTRQYVADVNLFVDGTALVGATNSFLDLLNVPNSAFGDYSVVVKNPFGTVTSQAAYLSVIPPRLSLSFGSTATLNLSFISGRFYQIEYQDDLQPTNNWQPLTVISASANDLSWTDASSTNSPRRFYRVVLVP